jgi:hypothetical protein
MEKSAKNDRASKKALVRADKKALDRAEMPI